VIKKSLCCIASEQIEKNKFKNRNRTKFGSFLSCNSQLTAQKLFKKCVLYTASIIGQAVYKNLKVILAKSPTSKG